MIELKKELKTSIINIWFFIPLLILLTISSLDIIFEVRSYNLFLDSINGVDEIDSDMCIPIFTSFNYWIGNSYSIYSTIYFWASPLLASLPYSWAYCYKRRNANHIKHDNLKNDYTKEIISVFISSGLITIIPLLTNFLVSSLFIPSIKPDSIYDINYGIFSNNFVGTLFYNFPYFYILFYSVLNFVFNGLLGCLGMSISTITKSKTVAILFPAVVIFLLEKLRKEPMLSSYEMSPISFLCPKEPQFDNGYIIFGEILILIVLITVFFYIGLRGKKK